MTLAYIVLASLAGGVLSAVLAGLVASRVQPRLIPVIVSYAVGALLGVVFLDLLPHIFESGNDHHLAAGWILAGILAFFVMEKLVLWRHDHDHAGAAEAAIAAADHGHAHHHAHAGSHGDHGRAASAWTIIIGDGFHNFTDGFAIATAFMADTRLGIVTALAIVAHELPQELGDFLVLVHSGFSRARAMFWNIMSSIATVLGALLAYFALQTFSGMSTVFLCIAASSMIYVAIADLIPGLHRKSAIGDSLVQFALIALGVGSIVVVQTLISH
ncbi:MAG TPA: ZIP family metal transporter [Usitatibacteraceae bacterium]|nr:ZIP family metal transporter [Usitatibacteraceae bacterium]